jgi:outer membrane protein assembly factor BamB
MRNQSISQQRTVLFSFRSCICGLSWLACVASVQAANWPGFRGPAADGIAEKEKAPTHFGQASNLLWKTEMLPGHSSPAIWNGQLFLTSADGNKLSTIGLDCRSGNVRWEQNTVVEKLEPIHQANSHASSTPVTDGKRLYVYFGSFGLLAYDLAGKELWRKPLPMPRTFFDQGTGTSPILAEDKLVVFVQVGKDSHLLAVSPASGETIWKAPMPDYNNSWATPVSWKENDKGLVGMVCAKRFTAFDLAEGKEAWWVNAVGYQACSTPVVAPDSLVIAAAGVQGEVSNMIQPPSFEEAVKKYGHDGDQAIAYEDLPDDLLFTDRQTAGGQGNMTLKKAFSMFGGVNKGDKVNRGKWEEICGRLKGFRTGPMNRTVVMTVRKGGKQDVTESQIVWQETKGVPEVPSPLVWHDRLYLIRSGGILVCRDVQTGKLVYEERIDSPGGYFASPLLVDGRIYVASDRGTVTVIKAGDSFEVLARNGLGEPIIASPAIADNVLYFRSSQHLWAFVDKKE